MAGQRSQSALRWIPAQGRPCILCFSSLWLKRNAQWPFIMVLSSGSRAGTVAVLPRSLPGQFARRLVKQFNIPPRSKEAKRGHLLGDQPPVVWILHELLHCVNVRMIFLPILTIAGRGGVLLAKGPFSWPAAF